MNRFNIEFPYPIGTYLSKKENGIVHIDQVCEYIVDRNGISVVVILDALSAPRLSTRIDINRFVNNWTKCEKPMKRKLKNKKF